MTRFKKSPIYRKHLPDLVAGLAVFALMIGLTGWHIGIAVASDGGAAASLDRNASALLLAGAFAAMAVFNMAFFRHLCRAYATPRKAAARRALRSGQPPRT
ncbi:MAG: hypothetical protein JNN24_05885 [Hyphomicrobium zavarzinii]|jgi:hypothetical protein|uniref:hypothetical protein n=1 Tax=Hyphomicrobium TaxID=81 RepID=UPI0003716417|nr:MULTISPECIES: hypothetical protein [Hyphomicrobium]MBL8845283.1 hypothetical protein [Hyphomicrobium zavarzinii]WBT40041.1 hypothetical protein PE058_09220 [Hyphomicrobium sp. DMF-1]HML43193.1 hypothetical protein [Hyphomicrobium zavarzinii]